MRGLVHKSFTAVWGCFFGALLLDFGGLKSESESDGGLGLKLSGHLMCFLASSGICFRLDLCLVTAGVADEGSFPFPGFGGLCLAPLFCGSGEVVVEGVAPGLHFSCEAWVGDSGVVGVGFFTVDF